MGFEAGVRMRGWKRGVEIRGSGGVREGFWRMWVWGIGEGFRVVGWGVILLGWGVGVSCFIFFRGYRILGRV